MQQLIQTCRPEGFSSCFPRLQKLSGFSSEQIDQFLLQHFPEFNDHYAFWLKQSGPFLVDILNPETIARIDRYLKCCYLLGKE